MRDVQFPSVSLIRNFFENFDLFWEIWLLIVYMYLNVHTYRQIFEIFKNSGYLKNRQLAIGLDELDDDRIEFLFCEKNWRKPLKFMAEILHIFKKNLII